MKELILVVVGAALVNNIILSQFQGLCPFLGVSKKTDTAAVTVVVMAVPILIFILSESQILETMASSGLKD